MPFESDAPRVTFAAIRAQEQQPKAPFLKTDLPDGAPWMTFHKLDDGYLVRIINYADFKIANSGSEVVVHAAPGASKHTVEHLYQNQALPLALSLKKKLVMHGSAVEIEDGAVAFLAQSGHGKSTLAASFSSNGFPFLTDDGLQIDLVADEYVVRSSHPSIRLWDDSRVALTQIESSSEPPVDYSNKAQFLAGDQFRFCTENRPLRYVYFLGDGSSAGIEIIPVSGKDSIIEMIRHCFLLGVDEHEMLAHNLNQLARLSRLPIFFRLDYPRCYDILSQVRDAVVKHSQVGVIP